MKSIAPIVQGVKLTSVSKAAIINELAIAFEQQTIRIFPDPTLLGELLAYSAERLPSGALRYSAPPGQHDDTVVALALALASVRHGLPASIPSQGDPFAVLKNKITEDSVKMVRTETGVKFLRPERKRSHGVDPFAKVSR